MTGFQISEGSGFVTTKRFGFYLSVLAIAILCQSCVWVKWQAPFPTSDDLPLSPKMKGKSTIYFNLPDYFNASPSTRSHFLTNCEWLCGLTSKQLAKVIQQGLTAAGFEEVIMITKPPDTGIFCSITLSAKDDRSRATKAYWLLTQLTIGALPYYGETSTYAVTYELYVDGRAKNQYQYQIKEEEFRSLGALLVRPFMSNDWVTVGGWGYGLPQGLNSFATAIGATAKSFLADAGKDGSL